MWQADSTDMDKLCLSLLTLCPLAQRAYKRYEASMQMMVHLEDRQGQLIAINGMAKTLGLMRRQSKICDCRPLEINNKVIDLASSLGCKVSQCVAVCGSSWSRSI